MRKRYKCKSCCCALCKAHKRGWDKRWKPAELARLAGAEAEIRAARRGADGERGESSARRRSGAPH